MIDLKKKEKLFINWYSKSKFNGSVDRALARQIFSAGYYAAQPALAHRRKARVSSGKSK